MLCTYCLIWFYLLEFVKTDPDVDENERKTLLCASSLQFYFWLLPSAFNTLYLVYYWTFRRFQLLIQHFFIILNIFESSTFFWHTEIRLKAFFHLFGTLKHELIIINPFILSRNKLWMEYFLFFDWWHYSRTLSFIWWCE